jgi:trigger factor
MQGELIQGGEGKNRPVHLGEGYFIPDFEKKIIGMKAGEERQFSVTFPDDFPNEIYRGKEATVWVKTHQVQKRILPELNDEFAKSLGKFSNLEELKSQLKSGMQQEQEQKEKERVRGQLSASLAEKSAFSALPDILIQKEIDRRLEELKNLVQLQGRTMDQYLKESKKTLESVREEIKGAAIEHIKISLALRAFAQQQEITATEEEIDKKITTYLSRYASSQDAQQHIHPNELRENITANIKSQKALDRLEQLSTIKNAQ